MSEKHKAENSEKLKRSVSLHYGKKRKKQNIEEDKADNSRMDLPKCSLDFTLRGMCKIGMLKGDE